MRATAMSMFLSRPRATASSSVRSTRGPGVRKGADDWAAGSGATGVWPAGIAGAAGVCAIAGDSPASTRAADSTTFFFTNASNTLGLETRLLTIAATVARPLTAPLLRHRVELDALLGRQELVDAVQHEDARFADVGPHGLDPVELLDDGGFIGRGVEHHPIQRLLELVELFPRLGALLVVLAP